ncbi:MAG: glycosyltransferase [Candidatus Rokuibacteriota bacterium]
MPARLYNGPMVALPGQPAWAPDGPPYPEPSIRVSVVVPVYRGERTLGALTDELLPLTKGGATPGGHPFRVTEVVLVHDGATDGSADVMIALAARHPFIVPVWLSRNYGQHAATLAGMASTSGDWVVTLDEDGQQDPNDIGRLLDRALATGAQLVYASPANAPPHGPLRNGLSRLAKRSVALLVGNSGIGLFNSFRLMSGEIARSLAAFCGHRVYLDIALGWVVDRVSTCPVLLREERGRPSGYTFLKLASHFWRLVLTAGTRPLRAIALVGIFSILVAIGVSVNALHAKLVHQVEVAGWTSLVIMLSFFSGVTLLCLSVIAEYLGVALNMAMGKPTYLVVSQPPRKPPGFSS